MTPDAAQLSRPGLIRLSTCPSLTTAEVARRLGAALHLEGISATQTLAPTEARDAHQNRYSGIYGTKSFPLHTDMAHWHAPPHYFLLRCVHPAEIVPTYFVTAHEIFAHEPELVLKRALFRPRRRLDGRLTCLRLHEGELYRWDPVFLDPVNTLAVELRARVLHRTKTARKYSVALSSPGDCLLVNNWTMLHGRAEVPPSAMQRRLERVYLDSINI